MVLPIVSLPLQVLKHELSALAGTMIHLAAVDNAEIIIRKIKRDSVLQGKQHPGHVVIVVLLPSFLLLRLLLFSVHAASVMVDQIHQG